MRACSLLRCTTKPTLRRKGDTHTTGCLADLGVASWACSKTCMEELLTQTEWLHRQIRDVAAQTLVVPSPD